MITTDAPGYTRHLKRDNVFIISEVSVRLGSDDIAEVYFNEKWVPICGHWFWDNNIGATLFCQKLGFESGAINERFELKNDGLRVGQCNSGDAWLQCSRCNELQVGGQCDGGGSCNRGQTAAFSISCFDEGMEHIKEGVVERFVLPHPC